MEKEYDSLPKLMEPSTILQEEHLKKVNHTSYKILIKFKSNLKLFQLNVNLIPRAVGYDWILSFSTDLHGFSLGTLYRQLAEIESPCLLIVKDSNNNVKFKLSN